MLGRRFPGRQRDTPKELTEKGYPLTEKEET